MSADASIADVLEGRARWSVTTGDCLQILPTLPDKSVAHVITDPPYEAEAHTMQRRVLKGTTSERARGVAEIQTKALTFGAMDEVTRGRFGTEAARLAVRWALVFCQAEAVALWREALRPLVWKRSCVWVKPDGMPQLSGDRPGMGYESIACAHAPGRSRWNGGGLKGVFSFPCLSQCRTAEDHPTQKPLALMVRLVELFADDNEIVADPFCGSASTGVACLRLGRRFIGIELNPKYAQIARDRLTAEGEGQSLRSFRDGQIPLFKATP